MPGSGRFLSSLAILGCGFCDTFSLPPSFPSLSLSLFLAEGRAGVCYLHPERVNLGCARCPLPGGLGSGPCLLLPEPGAGLSVSEQKHPGPEGPRTSPRVPGLHGPLHPKPLAPSYGSARRRRPSPGNNGPSALSEVGGIKAAPGRESGAVRGREGTVLTDVPLLAGWGPLVLPVAVGGRACGTDRSPWLHPT